MFLFSCGHAGVGSAVRAIKQDDAARRDEGLTVAMDAGYRTLSTFDRAFEAKEGETPSAFRKRTLRSSRMSGLREPPSRAWPPS